MDKFSINDLNLYYGDFHALKSIDLHLPEITAFIGPSGCGKSTLLRCFNRMNDLIDGAKVEGDCCTGASTCTTCGQRSEVRRRVGMVFQKPNPFPKSIYDNIAYAPNVLA
jgi:phosphate transport system ATP-binding protein